MLLKSIDLQGYKTFAGRTTFEFTGAITCIVGPNGSGKSNIADAIRWVLGEQSYTLMRGKKTEDMIFSGSESRSRAGMASSNIIFDNTTGWLPIDFSEVAITRRAFRDGRNEYLINGQRVRLRDITELLGNSGLSERTYTIIGQGLVDAALALRAEERRRLFEEAAGIGIYRSRRNEAQRRLETTKRNLERVEYILSELKPRVRSLERQARRAAQFDQVENDLKALLRDYYGYHWYKAQKNLSQARESARGQENKYELVQDEQDKLDDNLTNLRNKVNELRSRLGAWHLESSNLHNQRSNITRDLAVSNEREQSLLTQNQIASLEINRLEQQISIYKQRVNESEKVIKKLQDELSEAKQQLETSNQLLASKKSERELSDNEVGEIQERLSYLRDRQNRLQASFVEKQSQIETQKMTLREAVLAVEKLNEEKAVTENRFKKIKRSFQETENEHKKFHEEAAIVDDKLKVLEEAKHLALLERSEFETKITRLNTRLAVLEGSENSMMGFSRGAQILEKEINIENSKKMIRILSNQLEVPNRYERAISASLGSFLDAVIIDDDALTEDALNILVEQSAGGTIIPLSRLLSSESITAPRDGSVIGVASEFVDAPEDLRKAVEFLLGQTLIVENRVTAQMVLRDMPLQTRAVTLKGELFYKSGPITVGIHGDSSILSRPKRKQEISEEISKFEKQYSNVNDKIGTLEREISEYQSKMVGLTTALNEKDIQLKAEYEANNKVAFEIEKLTDQVGWQRDQVKKLENEVLVGEETVNELSEVLDQLREDISLTEKKLFDKKSSMKEVSIIELESHNVYWKTQITISEQALSIAERQYKERSASLDESIHALDDVKQRISLFEKNLSELIIDKKQLMEQDTQISKEIDNLRLKIDPAATELDLAETEQLNLQQAESKSRKDLNLSFRQFSNTQLALSRQEEILENLREKIENDLGLVIFEYDDEVSGPTPLPMHEMVERLPRVDELPEDMERTIRNQRVQAKRMGGINPDAQKEYKEEKERFEFLNSQVEDLQKAEKDVNLVIEELDSIMEREFKKTFEEVAQEFREVFTRLFGGGSARLIMTDPGAITETGIDIEARLPGRRDQGLSLLSGGERSLTATALVFALLKVSPTPFCVLDEVDAMLDEANVGRFRDLLRELAENTQFIVITHNRNTVQAADVIYGVTMGRDSASQVISLKLDEVAEVV